MKRVVKYGVILALVIVFTTMLSISSPLALANQEANTSSTVGKDMTAFIRGLEAGDEAILSISSEGDMTLDKAFMTKTVTGTGKEMSIVLPMDLKDGSYQIEIDATDKYFRSPRGYFFVVLDSKVCNPESRSIIFDLISRSARDYEPYRGSFNLTPAKGMVSPPSHIEQDRVTLKSEPFRDLSAPKKRPLPKIGEFGTKSTKYYVNFGTSNSVQGVYGTMTPVNTGVTHPYPPSGTDFIVGHIYTANNGAWIEVGWVDASWKNDYRYLYTYNSVDATWEYHGTLTDDSAIYVFAQLYSGTTWKSYWFNGATYVELDSANLGYTSMNNTFIGGEIDNAVSPPPTLPQSNIISALLRVDGIWDQWDTTYYTMGFDYSPYHKHVTNNYWNWYMHTD